MIKELGSKIWRPALGLAGFAAVVFYSAGAWRARMHPTEARGEPGAPLPAGAQVVEIRTATVTPEVGLTGSVASAENIHLSSRVSAYVETVGAGAGMAVTKGQTLVALDGRELREQLTGAEVQVRQAETEFRRTSQLFASQAATEQQLTAAKAALDAAKSQAARVNVMLTYTAIDSPIDGVVTERHIEVGDLANPGQVLMTVYDPRRMRLEVPVPVRLVEKLALGQAVQMRLERPARSFAGKVAQIVGEIDAMSRTQTVKIDLEDIQGGVLPGTFGRLLLAEEPRPAILLPAAAVARRGQLEMVKAVESGRVFTRLVKTAPAPGGQVEILSGLKDGDRALATF